MGDGESKRERERERFRECKMLDIHIPVFNISVALHIYIVYVIFQYLERNNIKEFGRENFSFNTRVKVGQFFEGQAGTAVSASLQTHIVCVIIGERHCFIQYLHQY